MRWLGRSGCGLGLLHLGLEGGGVAADVLGCC